MFGMMIDVDRISAKGNEEIIKILARKFIPNVFH